MERVLNCRDISNKLTESDFLISVSFKNDFPVFISTSNITGSRKHFMLQGKLSKNGFQIKNRASLACKERFNNCKTVLIFAVTWTVVNFYYFVGDSNTFYSRNWKKENSGLK